MCNRKSRVFLGVSLVLFAASVVEELIRIIGEYRLYEAKFANDSRMMLEIQYGTTVAVLVVFVPMFLLELSFIRSCYKLLKNQPHGAAKVCWILSAILAIPMFLLPWLQFHGIVDLNQLKIDIDIYDVMLLFGFPLLLVSLILGSIPMKEKKPDEGYGS